MDDHAADPDKPSLRERLRPLRGHLWALVVLLASLASVLALSGRSSPAGGMRRPRSLRTTSGPMPAREKLRLGSSSSR